MLRHVKLSSDLSLINFLRFELLPEIMSCQILIGGILLWVGNLADHEGFTQTLTPSFRPLALERLLWLGFSWRCNLWILRILEAPLHVGHAHLLSNADNPVFLSQSAGLPRHVEAWVLPCPWFSVLIFCALGHFFSPVICLWIGVN